MTLNKIFFFALLVVVLSTSSCSDSNDPTPELIVSTNFSNLDADAGTGRGSMGEVLGATGKFTFFSFKTGAIVDHADSASTKWDIAFRGTVIIVNSATSGPGTAQIQVMSGLYNDLLEAPVDGYKSDNDAAPIDPAPNSSLAIPTGSNNGWYTYDAANFIIKPTPGKFLVIKTSDGKYAKMEITNYYKDAPASPNYMTDIDRYYTFRYVYQPNDSRKFE